MDSKNLKEVLDKHQKWLKSEKGGERANLRGANLRGANLYCANLRGANLYGANLSGANLYCANLRGANLRSADLSGADLSGANLRRANLRSANLRRANLRSANLYGANLRSANLYGANLYGANLSVFSILPAEGDFIGFKKLQNNLVAKLLIPAKAKRVCTPTGRKCRAEYVKVLEITNFEGKRVKEGAGLHDLKVIYKVGRIVKPDKYDDDIRVECTHGIHFFITKKEAEQYN